MVVGDLNANVGGDNTGRKWVMGTQCFGCINNNGEKLSDLCVNNNLVIGGTTGKISRTGQRSEKTDESRQESFH